MNTRLLLTLVALAAAPLTAQTDFSKVNVTTVPVAPSIHMLQGAGGNVGVFSGPDGVIVIDDQYAPMAPKLLAAVREISKQPLRFVLNTHWHGDHTGGNEQMGDAGAVIVAHENVRKRMSASHFNPIFERTTPAADPDALPVVTFTDSVRFHMNGATVEVIHVRPAHTDGDSIVRFPESNVIHTGDVFFNGNFPFVDTSSGGSLEGMIAVVDRILESSNDATKIIPGHGPLATKNDLRVYAAMLREVQGRMENAIRAHRTREAVLAAKPLASLDEKWGTGFINAERLTSIIFDSMNGARDEHPHGHSH